MFAHYVRISRRAGSDFQTRGPDPAPDAPQASAGKRGPAARTCRAPGGRRCSGAGSSSSGQGPDRRRVPRKQARTFGLIQDARTGDQIGIAAVLDLSASGAGIRMAEPLARGAVVRILVEKKLAVARVKHCLKDGDQFFRIGLEFTAA